MKQNNNSGNEGVSEHFEDQVFRTHVEKGHIIPETESEVRLAEERMEKKSQPLPEALRDGQTILARIKNKTKTASEKVVPMPPSHYAEAGEELARAARKGAEIPPEIEEKMRRNRAKADAASKRKPESK